MLNKELNKILTKEFKNIFVVENRTSWIDCSSSFDVNTDLVFCIDFGLKKDLEKIGANVFFFDHIVEPNNIQEVNHQMHHFLDNWYKNDAGEPILVYKGLNLGDSLLLNLTTDVSLFCHFFVNAIAIKKLKYQSLFISVKNDLILNVFKKINLKYTCINNKRSESTMSDYSFPISYWANSKLYKNRQLQKVVDLFKTFLELIHNIYDLVNKKKPSIYIQDYYPTQSIISSLLLMDNIIVRTPQFSLQRSFFKQRRIPKNSSKKLNPEVEILLNSFIESSKVEWHYAGHLLSEPLYDIIITIVTNCISDTCKIADTIIGHFQKNNYLLVIPVTNYWIENRLIMNYARNNKIPVFMITNGLLSLPFEKDGRDSDYINCYSVAVKEDYFDNSENVFCLGDPRMDKYMKISSKKVNRNNPVIIIGTAGFNPIDLNSYLSFEFDFLYDILEVLSKFRRKGLNNKIILKVRDNGFAIQYQKFVNEYFSELHIDIIQHKPFFSIISQADLYISIYSQTLIEASCLGIPVIYYKKDTQYLNRPFDGNSELVTANNISELEDKIDFFYNSSCIYNAFMKKSVLEKYVGPLDGLNTSRNLDFIDKLMNLKKEH
jgi:hypothetical protein